MQIPSSGSIFSALGSLTGSSGPAHAAAEVRSTPQTRPTAPVQHPNAVKQAVTAQAAGLQPANAQPGNGTPPANLPRGSLLNIKV